MTTNTANILDLPFKGNSVESLSCMHVVEHIGLGRYGDPMDPEGDIEAIKELKRVVMSILSSSSPTILSLQPRKPQCACAQRSS